MLFVLPASLVYKQNSNWTEVQEKMNWISPQWTQSFTHFTPTASYQAIIHKQVALQCQWALNSWAALTTDRSWLTVLWSVAVLVSTVPRVIHPARTTCSLCWTCCTDLWSLGRPRQPKTPSGRAESVQPNDTSIHMTASYHTIQMVSTSSSWSTLTWSTVISWVCWLVRSLVQVRYSCAKFHH